METLWQDLRYSLRLIRQRPGYTAVAILTLALGIGATTTIFTIADAVLFRPLPFRAPDRLVEFWNTIPSRQMTFPGLSPAALQEWRKQDALVEGIEGYNVSGTVLTGGEEPELVQTAYVTHGLFSFLGVTPKFGRNFTPEDIAAGAERVAVISHGKRWRIGGGPKNPWHEIVGVVGDTKDNGLRAGFGTYGAYYPFGLGKNHYRFRSVLIRTADDPTPLIAAIKSQVWAIDKDQPITRINTIDSLFSESLAQQRFNLLLMGVFAVVALLLAGSGIYGVINYTVSQRTHEIGIRCALGAQRADIMRLVIRQGIAPLVLVTLLGLGGALALTRYISTLLYEVSAYDPLTLAGVVVLLAAVALAACYAPARRATRVDPLVALRYE